MFVMMVGIPASGKSFKAKELEKEGFVILSSDIIRKDKGFENDNRADNKALFEFLRTEAIKNLEEGKDVVLDATNTLSKYRKWFLEGLPADTRKVAYFFDTPIEVCLGRNALRTHDRVPEWAYKKKFRHIDIPSIEEGFDNVCIIKTVVNVINPITRVFRVYAKNGYQLFKANTSYDYDFSNEHHIRKASFLNIHADNNDCIEVHITCDTYDKCYNELCHQLLRGNFERYEIGWITEILSDGTEKALILPATIVM